MQRFLDLENDGLNMVADEEYLFIRCRKEIIKVSLSSFEIIARITLFKKDGQARYITVSNSYVCVLDFGDVYVLNKQDLSVIIYRKIGEDATSDLIATRCDDHNVYISVRNGKIGVLNILANKYNQFALCDSSSWEFTLHDDFLYVCTTTGTLYKIDKNKLKIINQCKLGSKNIYGIVIDNNIAYTISQDTTLKAINLDTFKEVKKINKAIKGMCRILGFNEKSIIIADQGISVWDKKELYKMEKLIIPTGHFNKGTCYNGKYLIGSDYHSLYMIKM